MKERPILMNEWSVNRILAGEKTQTRRVIKPPDGWDPQFYNNLVARWDKTAKGWKPYEEDDFPACTAIKCPYGEVGDQLWVREKWGIHTNLPNHRNNTYVICYKYIADNKTKDIELKPQRYDDLKIIWDSGIKPSIFMPREFSRIQLEITNIRIQRIQNINWVDSIKEGIKGYFHPYDIDEGVRCLEVFIEIWNDIHGDSEYDWDKNPWVWVIDFRVV